ncbi:flagellar basal body L-ring protein FlgH [Desulfovibrio inopinatus]|uniref:flagellar basal body L-ring protein FlgH n=1 Tax=Desulfovibrio inopinatus TaxID=102109 RepID=UPI0003FD75F7|nr:flagellar basal body L-ring protein FlgH [Desulfovibrio inopinatus]
MKTNPHIFIATAMTVLALTACTPTSKQVTPTPTLTPPVTKAPPPARNPGSLFSQNEPQFLFEDNRARRIGDIVMVNIIENSSGQNKAKTKSDKDSTYEVGVDSYFAQASFAGPTGLLGLPTMGLDGPTGANPLIKANTKNEFDSKGETSRSSSVSATVGCRIINILPGGVMQVEGARETRVNDETQILVVRGLVRPYDIDGDNTVPSTALANAQIEYYGQGVIADRQRQGWFGRVIDNIWPF